MALVMAGQGGGPPPPPTATLRSLPKSLFNRGVSSFAAIDPLNQLFYGGSDSSYYAVSYVWSDWKLRSYNRLPDWDLVRKRLAAISSRTSRQSASIALEERALPLPKVGYKVFWWLDSKCIDQQSEADKAHWVPRMGRVYAGAKYTVLLLRDIDLRPLALAAEHISCQIQTENDPSHDCILTHACCMRPIFAQGLEKASLNVLKQLISGTWRKRAWIFQEIALSRIYVLSGSKHSLVTLEDAALLSQLLFRRDPTQTTLGAFAEWYRQIVLLRKQYHKSSICTASLLKVTESLEATNPGDKYYALISILRLEGTVKYDEGHTATQALQAVLRGLSSLGQLSWAHAISPCIDGSSKGKLRLSRGKFATVIRPYNSLTTRKPTRAKKTRWIDITSGNNSKTAQLQALAVSASIIGTIRTAQSLQKTLREAQQQSVHSAEFRSATQLLQFIASDIVDPLTKLPSFEKFISSLGYEDILPTTTMAWYLYQLEPSTKLKDEILRPLDERLSSRYFADLVIASAWTLRHRVDNLEDDFVVVSWVTVKDVNTMGNHHANFGDTQTAIGHHGCAQDMLICKTSEENHLMAAKTGDCHRDGPLPADWYGLLYPIDTHLSEANTSSSWVSRLQFSNRIGSTAETSKRNHRIFELTVENDSIPQPLTEIMFSGERLSSHSELVPPHNIPASSSHPLRKSPISDGPSSGRPADHKSTVTESRLKATAGIDSDHSSVLEYQQPRCFVEYPVNWEDYLCLKVKTSVGTHESMPDIVRAAKNNMIDGVEACLRTKSPVDQSSPGSGRTALLEAAFHGNLEIVKLLHKNKANLEHRDHSSMNAVLLAVAGGKADVLQYLGESGADMFPVEEKSGMDPLHIAAVYNHFEVAWLLIEQITPLEDFPRHQSSLRERSKYEREDAERRTPLSLAIQASRISIAELYMKYFGAPVYFEAPVCFEAPMYVGAHALLMHAAKSGRLSTMKWAMNDKRQLGGSKFIRYMVLKAAVDSGNEQMVKYLLDRLPVRDKMPLGSEVIHWVINDSVQRGSVPITKMLLQHKWASPSFGSGWIVEGCRQNNVALLRVLIEGKVEAKDDTALHACAECGSLDAAKFLLEHGSSLEKVNYQTKSRPLEVAIAQRDLEMVKLFLQNGAKTKYRGTVNQPLHLAVEREDCQIVEALLEAKADVNITGANGKSALDNALFAGYGACAAVLLENGALHTSTGKDFDAAVRDARRYGHVDALKILLEHGASPEVLIGGRASFSKEVSEEERNAMIRFCEGIKGSR